LGFKLGLAALDPLTQHGSAPAEQRCRYIFRFYAFSEGHGHAEEPAQAPLPAMSFEQFTQLTRDISSAKQQQRGLVKIM
jgi:hypothetical protein